VWIDKKLLAAYNDFISKKQEKFSVFPFEMFQKS